MTLEERKELLLQVFLHVNKELDAVQRKVLEMVIPAGDDPDLVAAAILTINALIENLESTGWKPVRAEGDVVRLPDHYLRHPMEPTYFIVMCGGFHWCVENFIKYIVRYPFKNGIEDLKKAMRNLEMYLRFIEGDPKWSV